MYRIDIILSDRLLNRQALIFQQMSIELNMRYKTWNFPDHLGLFDYKDQSINFHSLPPITCCGVIYRKITDYDLIFKQLKKLPKDGEIKGYEPIISVSCNEHQYKITDIKNQKQPLSKLISDQNGDQLQEGTLCQIGKVKFQVLKIQLQNKQASLCTECSEPELSKISQLNYDPIDKREKEKEKDAFQYSLVQNNPCCRFCYSKSLTKNNNFIFLCLCEGSTKYIHEKCLADWIFMKSKFFSYKISKNKQTFIFQAKKAGLQCEICKYPFPIEQVLQLLSKQFEEESLFIPFKPLKKYVVLQTRQEDEPKIYIINIQNNSSILIGRTEQCEIFCPQVSVSRKHCKIFRERDQISKKEKLKIQDEGSKFGTLLKKSSFLLRNKDVIKVQKGRTYLEISVKRKSKSFIDKLMIMCSPDLTE